MRSVPQHQPTPSQTPVQPVPVAARTTRKVQRVAGWGVALLCAVGVAIPVNFVTEEPGPTFNTIGEYQGHQLISIEGEKTYPVSGNLDMTTVSVAGGPNTTITALQALGTWLTPSSSVYPSDLLYEPSVTRDQVAQRNTADMTNSQEIAQAAAMDYLKKPVGEKLIVVEVNDDGAGVGKFEEGDLIKKIGDKNIETFPQIAEVLDANKDKPIDVVVERDGQDLTVNVTPTYNEKAKHYVMGLFINRDYDFPFTVNYGLEDVGGPSAGMMFALGIIDELTEGHMTGGIHFAGTGTIETDGKVGKIGGIEQKMVGAQKSGATVFLAPEGNCDDVIGHIPNGLSVVKVGKLEDAVKAVEEIGEGKDPADFPTCK